MEDPLRDQILRDLDQELHDLCQPLTLLQIHLELGQLKGDPASLKKAVDGGIEETLRMFTAVARIRERLAQESKAQGD